MTITQIPVAPPTPLPNDLTVQGEPDGVLDSLTVDELEHLEATTGRLLSDVIDTVTRCAKEERGLPIWCLSFILYAMTRREYPEMTWQQFRESSLVDLTGKVFKPE